MVQSSNATRLMRIQARPGSLVEARHYRYPQRGWATKTIRLAGLAVITARCTSSTMAVGVPGGAQQHGKQARAGAVLVLERGPWRGGADRRTRPPGTKVTLDANRVSATAGSSAERRCSAVSRKGRSPRLHGRAKRPRSASEAKPVAGRQIPGEATTGISRPVALAIKAAALAGGFSRRRLCG
jgi:hypothetical protein